MLGKPLFALHCNIDRLKNQGRIYMWTFTRVNAEDYTDIRAAWNKLLIYLRRHLPGWAGVRVYEVHPGKWGIYSHGLHVHVVCNRWHDVNLVRSVAHSTGWGRVHVARVRKGTEYYVGKYIGKKRPAALKGWRLMATFGMRGAYTRIADVFVNSMRARLWRLGCATGAFAGLSYFEKERLVALWNWQAIADDPLHVPHTRGFRVASEVPSLRESPDYPRKLRTPATAVWSAMGFKTPLLLSPDWHSCAGGPDLQLSDLAANRAWARAQLLHLS